MTNKTQTDFELDESKIKIGQVIYILSTKETKVIPVQVCEMVNVQTLSGNTTSWKVAFGSEERRKVYDLNKVSGKKFSSLDGALNYIRFEFEQFVQIEKARVEQKVSAWFEVEKEKPKVKQANSEEDPFEGLDDEDDNIVSVPRQETSEASENKEEIVLENGSKGKIIMTDELKEIMK